MFFPNPRSNQTNFIKQKSRNRNRNTWLIISQICTKPTSTTNEFKSQTKLCFFAMSDLTILQPQSHINHYDRIPDSIPLLIFDRIGNVKGLGRCCVVSRRFLSLVPQVNNVIVRVDCVISDNDYSSSYLSALAISSSGSFSAKSSSPFSSVGYISTIYFCDKAKWIIHKSKNKQ